MDSTARPHLSQALNVVKTHADWVLIPGLVIGASYLSIFMPALFGGLLAFGSLIGTLVVYPFMYGRFTEIITGQGPTSLGRILQRHWWNFIAVSALLHSPLLLWLLISYSSGFGSGTVTDLLYGAVNVLSIYILPLVFLTGKRLPAITLGIKCLMGNFYFSLPLVFLSLVSIALGSVMGRGGGADAEGLASSTIAGLMLILLTVAVDFVVFVAASLVLKEKLFQNAA